MPVPKEVIDQAKQAHGEVYCLEGADVAVLVRSPKRAEYRKFKATVLGNQAAAADALETLLREVVVFPDSAAFDALLEQKPGLSETFGQKVLEIAGVSEQVSLKKL